MNPFVSFMSSNAGRIVRIVAGIAIIGAAFVFLESTPAIIVSIIGAVPLLAGVFDVCLFGPVFGEPLSGAEVRNKQ